MISNAFRESVRKGLNQVLRQAFHQNVSAQVSMLDFTCVISLKQLSHQGTPAGCSSSGVSGCRKPLGGSTELFLWRAGICGTHSGL